MRKRDSERGGRETEGRRERGGGTESRTQHVDYEYVCLGTAPQQIFYGLCFAGMPNLSRCHLLSLQPTKVAALKAQGHRPPMCSASSAWQSHLRQESMRGTDIVGESEKPLFLQEEAICSYVPCDVCA